MSKVVVPLRVPFMDKIDLLIMGQMILNYIRLIRKYSQILESNGEH